jgi:hypothetical protein
VYKISHSWVEVLIFFCILLFEVEAESQMVLNILTEHDYRDAFKNGRSAGNRAYARKGTTSRMMVVNRHKGSF